MFALRFNKDQLRPLVAQYQYGSEELALNAGKFMDKHDYLEKQDFLNICYWKTPRSQRHCQKNEKGFIKDVTRIALSTSNEHLKIEVLTLLRGVSWPTASVILHFGDKKRYPILDYRALWSLGLSPTPPYNFDLWWKYTEFCRELATENGLTMRELDKALWQYSKINQNGRK